MLKAKLSILTAAMAVAALQPTPCQMPQGNAGEPTIDDLRQRLGELTDRAKGLQDKADQDKRDLTAEEDQEIESIFAEFERVDTDIKRRERIENLTGRAAAGAGRRTEAAQPANAGNIPSEPAQPAQPAQRQRGDDGLRNTRLQTTEEKGRWGFAHFGEFLQSVRDAEVRGTVDQRFVRNSATTIGISTTGEDGGFAIPPDWRSDIISLVEGEDSLLTRCDQQRTSSNMLVVPVDETAPWHASGVRSYWVDEAAAPAQTKPVLQPLSVRANKLATLVYLTDELLEDGAAMGAYVQRKAPAAIQWKINDAIINGKGAGTPLGILASPCLVSVAAETAPAQPVDTIFAQNIVKMYSRMHSTWRRNAVWLYNQDIEPQLHLLNARIANAAGNDWVAGGVPIYMPPGGLSSSPYGSLMGRPTLALESCAAIGDVGDIIFANLGMYLALVKTGGVRMDISIHVEFEKDIVAFRFITRVGGQPWISKAVVRNKGLSLSPFVTLAAR